LDVGQAIRPFRHSASGHVIRKRVIGNAEPSIDHVYLDLIKIDFTGIPKEHILPA
jgi:hypothetical protein